jgi:hypothetical protein
MSRILGLRFIISLSSEPKLLHKNAYDCVLTRSTWREPPLLPPSTWREPPERGGAERASQIVANAAKSACLGALNLEETSRARAATRTSLLVRVGGLCITSSGF